MPEVERCVIPPINSILVSACSKFYESMRVISGGYYG